MKGLSHKVDQYLQQGPDLERLRGMVRFEMLGHFGIDSFEVIQNMHTPMGSQRMMSTPWWKGGDVSGNGRTMLFRNLAHSKATNKRKASSSRTCT
jgi:hypothetical protein